MPSFPERDRKLERFLAKNQHTQRKIFYLVNWHSGGGGKNCQNQTFKVNFLSQKLSEFIFKKQTFYWTIFSSTFLISTLFDNFNFCSTLFSKMTPNFWRLITNSKNIIISSEYVDFWAKIYLILYLSLGNSITHITITGTGARQKWMINWHILEEEDTGHTVANLVL